MNTKHTDSVETIVASYRNLHMPAELRALLGKARMTVAEADKIDDFVVTWIRSTFATLQATQSQQVEEAVRKYLQEKVVLYVSDNQSHESLSHEDRLKINADECIIYLGDEVKDVWGDDWNDAPDYCNSGSPYENTVKGLVKIEVKLGKPLLPPPNHQD